MSWVRLSDAGRGIYQDAQTSFMQAAEAIFGMCRRGLERADGRCQRRLPASLMRSAAMPRQAGFTPFKLRPVGQAR